MQCDWCPDLFHQTFQKLCAKVQITISWIIQQYTVSKLVKLSLIINYRSCQAVSCARDIDPYQNEHKLQYALLPKTEIGPSTEQSVARVQLCPQNSEWQT